MSTLAGLSIYTSAPPEDVVPLRGAVLFLPDGFGLARHNQRLADMYAQRGYETTIVDYFEGDALPDFFMLYTPGTDLDAYTNITPDKEAIRKIDMANWLSRHSPEHVSSLMRRIYPAYFRSLSASQLLKGQPSARISVVGHCFGGKHALRLAQQDNTAIGSVAIFHPSYLEDIDLKGLQRPVLVGCAETDVFTPGLVGTLIKQLPACGTTWKLLVYGGTQHGFASRADLGNEWTAKMYAQAFDDGLQWFQMELPKI